MSSKRKKRYEEWLKREEKRRSEKAQEKIRQEAMNSGNIEKMANALGIRLN